MFGLLFGKRRKKDFIPPTEKQLKYAKMIGLEITPEMSKWDVSRAIDNKVNSSPKLQRQQRHIERSKRIKQYGEELVDREDYWLQFIENTGFMLAIYKQRKEIVVDVLYVDDVEISEGRKFFLNVAAPKALTGGRKPCLIWEREFRLNYKNLIHHDPLYPEFEVKGGVREYKKLVKQGIKRAKQIAKEQKL